MPVSFNMVGVDIFQLPEPGTFKHAQVTPGRTITIGDLHGNTMYLIFVLLAHGFASGMTAKNYQTLVDIYKKDVDDVTREDIATFSQIIRTLTFVNYGALRLIGDDVCDRGSNDKFTWMTYVVMAHVKMNFTVIASNHTLAFIKAIETSKRLSSNDFRGDEFTVSMTNLQKLIDKGLVTPLSISAVYYDIYVPRLKLIDYFVMTANNMTTVYLFIHAPNEMTSIKGLAKIFDVEFHNHSLEAFLNTIEQTNAAYSTYLRNGNLHTLLEHDNVLNDFVWNRNQAKIEKEAGRFMERKMKPYRPQPPFEVQYVHGHVGGTEETAITTNVDGILAKRNGAEWNNVGFYRFFMDTSPNLRLIKRDGLFLDRAGKKIRADNGPGGSTPPSP